MLRVSPLSSLQTRITVAVVLVFTASLWVYSSWAGSIMRSEEQRMLQQRQRAAVTMLATQIDAALDIRFRALEQVATDVSPRLVKRRGDVLALLQERPVLQTLFNADVFSTDSLGRVQARWPRSDGAVQALSLDALSTKGRARGVEVVYEQNQWFLWLSVPVMQAPGTVLGVLVGRERLGPGDLLQSVLQRNDISDGTVVVRQQRGTRMVLADTASTTAAPKEQPGWDMGELAFGEATPDMTDDGQGKRWLVSEHATSAAPWVVSARTGAQLAFAEIYARQGQMLLATLTLTIVVGALTWWVIRVHLAPMRRAAAVLATQSDAPRPGDVRLHAVRRDEVGILIERFNWVLDAVDRSEEALRQSERRHADILNNIDSYVYLKDREGRYLFANRSMCQALGRPLEAVVGLDDRHFFKETISAQLRGNDKLVFTSGEVLRVDETLDRDGPDSSTTFLTVKFPIRNAQGQVEALCGISTDITQRKRQEMDLRIAATAFECQEGIVVLAADLTVMRVNSAFCRMMGHPADTASNRVNAYLRSQAGAALMGAEMWSALRATGAWRGGLRISRADGSDFIAKVAVSAVRDGVGHYTHYVVNLMDDTAGQMQEQQRLQQEASHRIALVREVHHRIKNNLQGILALMRQFAQRNPVLTKPMQEAIGQVQAISTIHGLQGRSDSARMRFCDLVESIVLEVSRLWRRPVFVHKDMPWQPWWVAELEAVPVALIVHELLLNAIKHSSSVNDAVTLHLRRSDGGSGVEMWLRNPGTWPQAQSTESLHGSGMGLIHALMPRHGGSLRYWQDEAQVCTVLSLAVPTVCPVESGSAMQ